MISHNFIINICIYLPLSQDNLCKKYFSVNSRAYAVDKILIRHTLVMKQKVYEHISARAMVFRNNGLSELWFVGTVGCRNSG